MHRRDNALLLCHTYTHMKGHCKAVIEQFDTIKDIGIIYSI